MSNKTTSNDLQSAYFGLPPRPTTASNPVWQHLLHSKDRTPTSLADIADVAPPLAPLDKNATSMRILLHDTQANFEKFGKHVGQLFEEIKDCKLEIKTVHSLFERDRESLMGDIIDLVNRSQKECQKSIGSPAQCQPVETFFKDVDHRMDAIDHRLDAIQSFNQSHTQALQTQIQAVQLLLDKQASIIAGISPLLPLLQALPLHIDTIKTCMNDALEKCMTTLKEDRRIAAAGTGSTTVIGLSTAIKKVSKRKWPGVDQSPSTSSTTPTSESPLHKKSRKEGTSKEAALDLTNERSSKPVDDISPARGNTSAATALHGAIAAQALFRRNDNDLSMVGFGTSPFRSSASLSSKHDGISAVPKFATSTPRRPLSDLPVHSSSGSSPGQRNKLSWQRHATRERSLGRSNTLAAIFSSANPIPRSGAAPTPMPSRLQILRQGSLSKRTKSKRSPHATINSLETSRTYSASSSGQGLISSNPLASRLRQGLSIKRENDNATPIAEGSNSAAPTHFSAGSETLSGQPKAVFRRQKDRKSPTREGKRFIPLVDSEDEDEDDIM